MNPDVATSVSPPRPGRSENHVHAARSAKGGRWHFPNAIRKYGPEAFSHEVLAVVTTSLEDANAAEQEWIKKLQTRDPEKGFNLAKGGASQWLDPRSTREKLSAATKRAMTPERRGGLSAARSGTTLSAETRAKMSASMKEHGRDISARNTARGSDFFAKLSQAGRKAMTSDTYARIAEKNTGRRLSPEQRTSLQDGHDNMSPEARERMKTAFLGKSHSLESRSRISESTRSQKRGPGGRFVKTE